MTSTRAKGQRSWQRLMFKHVIKCVSPPRSDPLVIRPTREGAIRHLDPWTRPGPAPPGWPGSGRPACSGPEPSARGCAPTTLGTLPSLPPPPPPPAPATHRERMFTSADSLPRTCTRVLQTVLCRAVFPFCSPQTDLQRSPLEFSLFLTHIVFNHYLTVGCGGAKVQQPPSWRNSDWF